jgi:signal transduction histidine kinase
LYTLCQVAVDALSAIDRMECTVNDVLDFRKLDANLFKMCNKEVDVSAVVSRICHHCRSFLLPTVGLQYRVVPGEARACIDARRLHQIVVNGLRCVEGSGSV